MQLRRLTVRNLRTLADVCVDVDADLLVITGANGSGKTSFLEAIHLLGTGRSFRTRGVQDVVRRDADSLLVSGRFELESGQEKVIGIEKPRSGGARFRVDGRDVRTASELARELPLVVVTPDSQRLLTDGAESRRRLLDWLMFHVEPDYQAEHARYRRALRQRNAMLRTGNVSRAERRVWCEEMACSALALDAMRRDRLSKALPLLEAALSRLSALPVSLEYRPGWSTELPLETLLLQSWDSDVARGYTVHGPHRADLVIKVHGRAAQHVVSRGEGKILVFAVLVGFAELLVQQLARRPLMLVDELASELDEKNRSRFAGVLRDLGLQTFVTAVSESLVSVGGWERVGRYVAEQGNVRSVL